MLALQLDFFPILFHLFGVLNMLIAKDMRMTHYHFLADAIEHVSNVKSTFLLPYLGVENEVEHEVAEFLFHLVEIGVEDGLAKLVSLLNSEVTQALDGLGAVPWAARAHGIHNVQ